MVCGVYVDCTLGTCITNDTRHHSHALTVLNWTRACATHRKSTSSFTHTFIANAQTKRKAMKSTSIRTQRPMATLPSVGHWRRGGDEQHTHRQRWADRHFHWCVLGCGKIMLLRSISSPCYRSFEHWRMGTWHVQGSVQELLSRDLEHMKTTRRLSNQHSSECDDRQCVTGGDGAGWRGMRAETGQSREKCLLSVISV